MLGVALYAVGMLGQSAFAQVPGTVATGSARCGEREDPL
jgi:hypothetical protein